MIEFIKKHTPFFLRKIYGSLKFRIKIGSVQNKQKKALKLLKNKEHLNCVFFALFEEVWKYNDVYQLMEKNPRFNPIVLVCPIVNYGHENMMRRMEQCYSSYKKKGYNVLRSYDDKTGQYIDVLQQLKPDIILYTSPYRGLIDDRYYITNYTDILTIYVPYFMNSNKDYRMACNLELHNLVWRRYSETPYHKNLSVKYAINKGVNIVNTGFPGIEPFLCPNKNNNHKSRKLIIWAPHHTIEPVGIIFYSCFLQYSEFMKEMAKKYASDAFFVFKPHPLLRNALYKRWGKEKTDNYYRSWDLMENTSLNDGDYVDLFIESDAMIHDSASFIVEYLYLNKPVMRTLNGIQLDSMYNTFGLQCIENHYLGHNEQEIEQFIQNVIKDVDPMKEQRTEFINEKLMPKGSPSQNIIDDILDSIDNQILFRN